MKRIILFLLTIIIALSFGCTSNKVSESKTIKILKEMDTDGQSGEVRDFVREWYDEIITGLGQTEISQSVKISKAVAEFRVVLEKSFYGYNYYSIKIFKDGTASFKYIVFLNENFNEGEILVDGTVDLSEDQASSLLKVIKVNKFWSIPGTHPDESMGCDGSVFFIEGHFDKNSHLISMWEPEPKHGIHKINEAFAQFSETIEENPFNQWNK